ncbi:TPA: ATPase [Candidatus Dependentiae bacterium]|nr:MAG: Cation transport ATPase [candidate division TM6 bacterium GW2011_GWE2_31_21]KKP52538.1 MAG: Cation transport ATPase [candidate division TM6 bacterium GW2011_GWF2_33_332]HBS48444.1 ATPase [Candidatus Dependentiae bacterium]HBZ73293.1 ATPase [Candidatus Dependentiae bacterium]
MEVYQIPVEEIAKNLKTDVKIGLSSNEANERLKKFGPNSVPSKSSDTVFSIFISQFLNPLIFILVIATILSLLIGDLKDAIIIAVTTMINTIVGFFQEYKANKAAEKLRTFEISKCIVKRNGKTFLTDTKNLVVGDIVLLTAGSKVPADIRLTNSFNFEIQESILTGESQASQKNTFILKEKVTLADQKNMAFMGTFVINGRAEGIVVKTGKETEFGKIANLILTPETSLTPIQDQLKKFSWFIGGLMTFISLIILSIGLIRQIPLVDLIGVATALTVAAIPEGLIIAVTITLAIGMQRIFKKHALIKKLIAAETLGNISVICTDKTGTLTEGKMSVSKIITQNYQGAIDLTKLKEIENILQLAALNNNVFYNNESKTWIGSATEKALVEAAEKIGIKPSEMQNQFPLIDEIPFSSDLKYMATLHKSDTGQKLVLKGAPEVILPLCNLTIEERKHFEEENLKIISSGFRVLAFTYKDQKTIDLKKDLNNLTFAGLIYLQDKLRPTAANSIQILKNAGIRTIILTGDNAETARIIAKEIGLIVEQNGIITGAELEKMSDKELATKIIDTKIFARIDPIHKIRIVKILKSMGNSVAMIGDGVNDAPAILAADIGIALSSGSDLACEVADMVLLDNNLATVTDAVYEGRLIIDNIKKVLTYLLAHGFGEIILIGLAILFNLPMPITIGQILWINLISHGFSHLALTVEPAEDGIMDRKPLPRNNPIFTKDMKILIFVIGITTDIGLFSIYYFLRKFNTFDFNHLRTIIFSAFSLTSLFYVFSVRSMNQSIFKTKILQNKWLNLTVIVGVLMQIVVIYAPALQKIFLTEPLNLIEWGLILTLASLKLIFIEIFKNILISRRKKL